LTELEDLYAQLPGLTSSNHRITSPATDAYNCVAWVQRDLDRWYEPDFFWPAGVPVPTDIDNDLEEYVALFSAFGYEMCGDPTLEAGFLKIALYSEGRSFQHVAKQLPSGAWSSKAGTLHDLRHDDLDAFHGAAFMNEARAVLFMRRPYDGADQMQLEETGLIVTEGDSAT
jgi:hypothetical protein